VTRATTTRSLALATAAVFALNGTVISAWISRLPATKARLDADPRTIGLTLLMTGLGSLVAMPWVGPLAARYGSRRVEVVAALVSGTMLVLLAVTPTAVATGAALFVFGAAYGAWDVAMNVQGSHVDRAAGRDFMPRYHACWSVGAFAGAGIGALAASLGLPLVVHFGLAAVLAVVPTLLIAGRWWDDDSEDHPEPARRPDGTRRRRLITRALVLLGVITLCGTLLEGSAADWVALYMSGDRAQPDAIAALGYSLWAVAMAASRFAGTAVIARIGRVRAVRFAGLLAGLGVVGVLALPGLLGIAVGLVLWGAGVALVFPAAMSAGGEQPGRAADGIATVATIGYGGFLLGPPLIGLLAHQIGLGTALWVLAPLGLAIALLAPVVAPPRSPQGAEPRPQSGTGPGWTPMQ
jgi:MFS family permease